MTAKTIPPLSVWPCGPQRETEREVRESVCACVCMRERERENGGECVCMCVYEREREKFYWQSQSD
jgi:ferredoxin-thioredoxin reductase catalytic subunit